MKKLSDHNFSREAETGLVMIMFSAMWAGPCNLARPSFEAAAARFGNQMSFGEFDVDDNPVTPQKYGVRQLPLFLLLRDGIPQAAKAGAIPEEMLIETCNGALT
jgi:thioredoxin 1